MIIPRDMETDSWGPSGVLRLLQTGKERNPYKQAGQKEREGRGKGVPSQCTPWSPGPPGTGTWCCWLQVSHRSPLSPGGQVQRPVWGSQWPCGHWQPAAGGVGRLAVGVQGCPPLHPAQSHSCTHACSPSPGAPSSQGHTHGTGALWSLAGNGTDRSEGGTQSPWRLVHRHKGGSLGTAQSQSVLPVTHPAVNGLPCPWHPVSSSAGNRLSRAPQVQSNPSLIPPEARSTARQAWPLPGACPILRPAPSPTKQRSQRCPVTPALHRQLPL